MVEDPDDGGVVTRGFGDGDGLVGERLATLEWASHGELRAQGREHERARRVVGGDAVEGRLQDLDLGGVDDANGVVETSVVRNGGFHEPVGIAEFGGSARRVEERLSKGGIAGLALRGPVGSAIVLAIRTSPTAGIN